MKNLKVLCALGFAFFLLGQGLHAAPSEPPKGNVILIGWDGALRGRVKELLQSGKLPNLQKLIKEGTLINTRVVTGQTETKPGWAEILTGYSAVRLGIFSNKDYRPIPPGYTVLEKLKARYGDAITTIFIAAKVYNLGYRGEHSICVNAYTRDPVTHARSGYQDQATFTSKTRDGKPCRWRKMAGEPYLNAVTAADYYSITDSSAPAIGGLAAQAIEKYKEKPFFAFIHFGEPDEPGHVYGEASPQYAQGLMADDLELGKIVAELKRLGLYYRTTIFVTADHGFDLGKRSHKYAPLTTLSTNCRRKMNNSGDRKDVTPTILDWYGFSPADIKPALDGRSLFVK